MAPKLRQVVRDRKAFVRRLLVAELLARPGEGPLAPRFSPRRVGRRVRGGQNQ